MPSVVLATASYDHTIRFWEAPSGISYRTIQHTESQVNKLEITPDKQHIAAAGNPHVRLYEVATNNSSPITSFDGHKTNVTAVGFQKEGKWLYTASEDGTLKLWDLRAQGCQREYTNGAAINAAALHPNQVEIVTGDQQGVVRIWDLVADKWRTELTPEGEVAIRSVTIGTYVPLLVAANNHGYMYGWKLGSEESMSSSAGEGPMKIQAHTRYLLKCLFSPDSKLLASCSADTTIKIWRIKDREFKLDKTLTGHQRWVWDCAFSADSAYLVSASSDQFARLWDISQGETIRHYTGHHKAVSCVALNDAAH